MPKQIYGMIKNAHLATFTEPVQMGASEVFSAQSGRFVIKTGDDFDACNGDDDQIFGAVEFVGTTNSTDAITQLPVQTSCDVWYEMPATNNGSDRQTLTQQNIEDYRFDTADVKVISNVQYVYTNTATDNIFIIMGGDVIENTLYVRMNPNEMGQTAVA